jgi:nucleotide-binding universal stress UspA family protein
MKNILVPIDFSGQSEACRDIAVKIASKTKAVIHYIHTSESVAVEKEGNQEIQGIEEKLKSFASKSGNIKTKSLVTDGVPFDDVINYSEENNIDLIIISSDGTGTYHSSSMASNVLRITRLANCPVLIIPQNIRQLEINKIVFVSDFTYEYDYRENVEQVFQKLLDSTKDFKPKIELLYVKLEEDSEEKVKKCMMEFAESFEKKNIRPNIIKSKSVENGALGYAKEADADLICLIGHGSGNYYTQLRTSISEKLLEKTDLPILIIRVSN